MAFPPENTHVPLRQSYRGDITLPVGESFSGYVVLSSRFFAFQYIGTSGVSLQVQVSNAPADNIWVDLTGAADTSDAAGSFINVAQCNGVATRMKFTAPSGGTCTLILATA